ncbi:hypothetical protein [Erwinia billingiae]|uniref:hypothetical protein n=1 Tax=Erwinia billingiae TaxID=182337 RepID=UPI0011B05C1C|nr:hypothetical protein [Erwinia billingiae]
MVLARMTADGLPNPIASSSRAGEEQVVQQHKLILRKILKVGFDRNKELDALINKLELRDF